MRRSGRSFWSIVVLYQTFEKESHVGTEKRREKVVVLRELQ
jgi:hypothetical protein